MDLILRANDIQYNTHTHSYYTIYITIEYNIYIYIYTAAVVLEQAMQTICHDV